MFGLLKKIFVTAQDRLLKKYRKTVTEINELEKKYQELTDEELFRKTEEFKKRFADGETVDDLLVEAYATVKNTCRRLCGTEVHVSGYTQEWDMIPYDVQLLGAIAMHHGSIAEMQTGEGKTLTASMPLYLNALTGKPVHLVTVNDYLAKRDCEWIGSIFKKLGVSVASLTNDVPPNERKETYAADIVYGTASEFGFDYLRDYSMAMNKAEIVQRGHYFAMIDEIDSILIDEARTPLIISGPAAESRQMYDDLKGNISQVVRAQRDLCNRLATEGRKTLDSLGFFKEGAEIKKSKEADEAFKILWLVSKGTPRNKILKRIKENPDLRARIEDWETYFYSDQNKEEKTERLADLFIIIEERSSEYELTDKGIHLWNDLHDGEGATDFLMLDLGYEYAKIDESSLSDQEKMLAKVKLREEDSKRKERSHNLRQLFRAHLLMEKDVDYIIQDDSVVIIDENTGRPQPGRRFSDGLHQAIEAKEGLKVQGETQTYATVTLQNYFRLYDKLSGMTGTAMTEANEFKELYKLEVLEIPTHRQCIREDADDEIYMTEREKYNALLKEIQQVHEQGRPILIGTESVEISEKLARILKQNRLPHTILNAKNHAGEAEIIADAGKMGAITLATNMAGRGTDIKLKEGAGDKGGLHVIATTRHQSRRIDRQLRGRSGRLGDPGSSKFFVSFEDSLMRLFASPRMAALLQRFRPPEGEPISASVLNKSIETAQKRVEQRNYTMRKHTLEYDDVMNKQRQEIYSFRSDILNSDSPSQIAEEIILDVIAANVSRFFVNKNQEGGWDMEGFKQEMMLQFPVSFSKDTFDDEYLGIEQIEEITSKLVLSAFRQKLELQKALILNLRPDTEDPTQVLEEVVRNLLLRKIDSLWQSHLLSIDHLRSDVHLRAVGQKDPLIEFKQEAFQLFDEFGSALRFNVSRDLFRFEMVRPKTDPVQEALQRKIQMHQAKPADLPKEEQPQEEEPQKGETIHVEPKVGRNDDCPCGSGKKYKKCCGAAQTV